MLLQELLWPAGACALGIFIMVCDDVSTICQLILSVLVLHFQLKHSNKAATKKESTTRSESFLTKAWSNLVARSFRRVRYVAEEVHSQPAASMSDENTTNNNESSTEEIVFRPMRKISQGQKCRSIINKITPEKFDKLSEQLLNVLPRKLTHAEDVSQAQVVIESVFTAATRQHHYAEMYASLCNQLRTHFVETAPEVDFEALMWAKCAELIQSSVISPPPRAPEGLSAEDELDFNMKNKEIMVGSLKFVGELVSRQQIPVDGVMKSIINLITDSHTATISSGSSPGEPAALVKEHDAERERRLECACTMLTTIGPSLGDNVSAWGENVLDEIDRAFNALSRLVDPGNIGNGNACAATKSDKNIQKLSSRTRFLINDLLDLRSACWKEVRAHRTIKPTCLESRVSGDTPFSNGKHRGKKSSSDALEDDENADLANTNNGHAQGGVEVFVDFKMMNELPTISHTVECVNSEAQKIDHLRHLITSYQHGVTPICDTKVVILAHTKSFASISNLFHIVFGVPLNTRGYQEIDSETPRNVRERILGSFNDRSTTDWPNVLVINLDVAAWEDVAKHVPAVHLLVTFDVDSWFNNFLKQFVKWVKQDCLAVTFFDAKVDWGRACQLATLLQWKRHRVPPELAELVSKLPKRRMNAKWKPYLEKPGLNKKPFNKMESRFVTPEVEGGGKVPPLPQCSEDDSQLPEWYQCSQWQWLGGDGDAAASALYASRGDSGDGNIGNYCDGNIVHAHNDHGGRNQFNVHEPYHAMWQQQNPNPKPNPDPNPNPNPNPIVVASGNQCNVHEPYHAMWQQQNSYDQCLGLETEQFQSDATDFCAAQHDITQTGVRQREAFERHSGMQSTDKDFNARKHEEAARESEKLNTWRHRQGARTSTNDLSTCGMESISRQNTFALQLYE